MNSLLTCVLALVLLFPWAAQADFAAFSTSTTFVKANASGGTTINTLAKVTATGMLKALTTDTTIPLYLTVGGAGTSGNGTFLLTGPGLCKMDATNASGVANYYVVPSGSVAGDCHAQVGLPASGQVLGTLLDDATTSGSYSLVAFEQYLHDPATGAGSGTVTSVAMSVPAELSVAGSPVETTGTFAVTKATQTANTVWAGPTTGGVAQPAFRALVAADLPATTAVGTAGGNLAGTYPTPTVAKASANFAFTADITPTTLGGDVNDYNPTNFATSTVLHLNGGAADRLITGLAAGGDGDIRVLQNSGTTNLLTLKNQSASSSATGRFLLSDDVTLAPGEALTLLYDSTASRWRPTGGGVPDFAKVRPCQMTLGSASASAAPLVDDEDTPAACGNDYGRDWVVTAVACQANAASMTITPILTGGSATSVLTGACACGNGAWAACTVNGTPTLHSFSGTGATCSSTPCTMDILITSAGGTATYASIKITGRLR